jgi:hypothetical protein
MPRISSRVTDSSVEAPIMGVERCSGIVWALAQLNSETRMKR